jgi:hypothetical protein
MTNRLRLVSHFPGRLRVRAEAFRLLPDVASDVMSRLLEEPGIARAVVSPRTGSLVIEYSPEEVQLVRIVHLLVRLGGLHGLEVDAHEDASTVPRPGARLRDRLDTWDRAVRNGTSGRFDLRSALPGALAAAGAVRFFIGRRRVPEWYDLLFWSFVTFVNLNPSATAKEAAVGGR